MNDLSSHHTLSLPHRFFATTYILTINATLTARNQNIHGSRTREANSVNSLLFRLKSGDDAENLSDGGWLR